MRLKAIIAIIAMGLGFSASAQTISTRYAQPGIGGVVLNEFRKNDFVKPLDLPINSSLSKAGRTISAREQWLNEQNAGLQILNAYMDNLTDYQKMQDDAKKSISQADLDEAMMSETGEAEMIANILLRRLQNNYVLFINKEADDSNNRVWELYRIQLTPELYTAYINVLGSGDTPPSIPMKYVGGGKYNQDDIETEYEDAKSSADVRDGFAVFRRLTKEVPDLAIGGPIINAYPLRARIPVIANAHKLQRYYVYRTVEKNGLLKSKQVGIAYATGVHGDEVQLYTMSGKNGSPKRGDYATLVHGGLSSFSVTGMYGLEKNGNYGGVRIGYDNMTFLSPLGVSGHFLVDFDVQFLDTSDIVAGTLENGKDFSYVNITDNGAAYAVNPNPLRCALGLGYGVAWNLFGRVSIMPYFRVNATYTTFLSLTDDDKHNIGTSAAEAGIYLPIVDSYGNFSSPTADDKAEFWGARGDLGARFAVNIVKQVSFFVGAEYNYHMGFGKKTSLDITADKYFYGKDYLDHGRSAINIMAGIRVVTF